MEGDAWTQLMIEYHKAILSARDFAIDLGTNWLGTGSDVVTSIFQKVIQTDLSKAPSMVYKKHIDKSIHQTVCYVIFYELTNHFCLSVNLFSWD